MPVRGNAPGTCARALLVELWRFLQFRVAVEIVLDPKLRARFLQEGVDRHSTRTSLLLVELECRDAVQGQLRRVVIEIAGQYDAAGLSQLHIQNLAALGVPGRRLVDDAGVTEHVVFIVLEDDRLAFLQSRKSRGLKRAVKLSPENCAAFSWPHQ